MAKELLERKEVEPGLTWDLTAIFKTEEEFERVLEEVQILAEELIAEFEGKLKTVRIINECLDRLRELYQKIIPVHTYADLAVSVDQTDVENQKRQLMVSNITSDISSKLSFIESEIIQADRDVISRAISESKENTGYLKEISRKKDHALHPEAERVLSALSNTLNAPHQIYNKAKLADMDFGSFAVDGKQYPLSFILFEGAWEYASDTKLRHAAFEAFSKKLREYQHTIAAAYQTQVQKEKTIANLRGFDSVFDYLLFDQKVDIDLYNRQIDLIMEHLAPHMRKFAKLLQRIHGLEEMTFFDLKLEVDPEFEPNISVEESKKYIEGALSVLGDDYLEIIKRAYDERWIDFVQNKGKSTGAFCASPYGAHPYILISWTERMREVFVLAHELGHAGHFYLAHQNQNIFNSRPSQYCIEAPSTMNEM